ncbi:hypothetical protein WK60_00120 [Burkholderia ubonensis]|uniref:hypothetical protein n=1 Tax=Burkholderia ubonensis TaxID=101571 RepID=UPI000756B78C|nr:hypothetical protein [Burkholderia ubonensis]KVT98499.1 hypothetical protein WK60_00120 [Burkholderia ubonensis]
MTLFTTRTAELSRYRRINWDVEIAPRLEARFRQTAAHAKATDFYENLYVEANRNRRTVQLFLGQHPVGVSLDRREFDMESGAALVASQHVGGSVAILLYPYKSEAAQRMEKLIVWRIFDDPLDITPAVIDQAIRDFASYWRVSSALDGGSRSDRRRIDRLIRRDEFQSLQNVSKQLDMEGSISAEHTKHSMNNLVAKLVQWWPLSLFGLFGVFVTVIGGWQPFVDQLEKWWHPHVSRVDQSTSISGMPVIAGYYTFCPNDPVVGSQPDPKLLNFLYDIRQAAGKLAFLDVRINVACMLPPQHTDGGENRPFDRTMRGGAVEYSYHVPVFDRANPKAVREWLSGTRDPNKLNDLYADNGTFVTVQGDREGRNAITRLTPNAEGEDDIIYGPYLIKAGGEDAFMTLDLTAPQMDSAMQAAATAIDSQREVAHAKEAAAEPPIRVIKLPASFPSVGASFPVPPTPTLLHLRAASANPLPPIPPLILPTPAALPRERLPPPSPGPSRSTGQARQAAQ